MNHGTLDRELRAIEADADGAAQPLWPDAHHWPTLDAPAMHGLAGELVAAIAPNTEAAPVAMLLSLLVAYGNAIGDASRAMVGDDAHPARLYVALVGSTAAGAKGTSLAAVRPILRDADETWWSAARTTGFASGEAIIARLSGSLRDRVDSAGNEAASMPPFEKRALVIEPEFARLLVVNSRDGSTASPVLRGAWDDGRLQLVRARKELVAEGAHLSLLGHVTPDELRSTIADCDLRNGFANRVLFVCVRRTHRIPSPRSLDPKLIGGFGKRLRAAMDYGREERILTRTPQAELLWSDLYEREPEPEGLVGEMTARSAAQRLRLSVAYALLDRSPVIRPEHVAAAEAVWRYCAASVEHLFGPLRRDSVQNRLLDRLRAIYPSGLDGSEQHALFAGHGTGLKDARIALETAGLARTHTETTPGRDRIVTYAVPAPPPAIPLRTSEKSEQRIPEGVDSGLCSHNSQIRTVCESGDELFDYAARKPGLGPTLRRDDLKW